MQGKILIVDAIATNRVVLKVKLTGAGYEVSQAESLARAQDLARQLRPDLVIAAQALPDGTAAALCDALKGQPETASTAVLVLAPDIAPPARAALLSAGARDVLSKPVNDTLLLGRVRSLLRAQLVEAEWQMRSDAPQVLGLAEPGAEYADQGLVLMISHSRALPHNWPSDLRAQMPMRLEQTTASQMMTRLREGAPPDVFVLSLPHDTRAALDMLRLIADLRANAGTRLAGVLVLQPWPDPQLGAHALDLGADDLMSEGFDPLEMALRLKALLRRKRMGEQLRATVRSGLRAAVTDPLTGLYNRRYAMPQLTQMARAAQASGSIFAVMVADLDHFKRINDTYGHAAGDAVLVAVAARLRASLRGSDLIARIGGEEFLIVLPVTTMKEAQKAALRLCNDIAAQPFELPQNLGSVPLTISIGMALGDFNDTPGDLPDEIAQELLHRADKALYAAKGQGRNQVTLGRPAA